MCYTFPVRIDKYLKVCRLTKRRATAKALADAGLIFINGKPAKAQSEVKPGDQISLTMGRRQVLATILVVKEYASKEEAAKMYRIDSDTLA